MSISILRLTFEDAHSFFLRHSGDESRHFFDTMKRVSVRETRWQVEHPLGLEGLRQTNGCHWLRKEIRLFTAVTPALTPSIYATDRTLRKSGLKVPRSQLNCLRRQKRSNKAILTRH